MRDHIGAVFERDQAPLTAGATTAIFSLVSQVELNNELFQKRRMRRWGSQIITDRCAHNAYHCF